MLARNLNKLLAILTPDEHLKSTLLFGLILIMALLDVVGVASILPLMTVLANPELIHTNLMLNTIFKIFNSFGISKPENFLFALGFLVLILFILSLAFKAFTTYMNAFER